MKTLYVECKMGAAGDMLTGALFELLPAEKRDEALHTLQNLDIEGVEFSVEEMVKCGIKGTHVHVHINGHEEESHAHGVKIEEIHFHEVGNKDAIMDITAVCYLMNLIGPDKIIASPIHVGDGSVHCAHGIMPVPAPATEYLLRGIPYYQGKIKSELCTPTGAALIKYFAKSFGPQPMMKIDRVGIGCGKKDFEAANCVRIFMGETIENSYEDQILQLDVNVDDMTAEEIGFAMDRLFDAGAREVFTSSVYMKKNRPGILITVICYADKKEDIVKALFKYTTTIGIRQKICDRYILNREVSIINTPNGDVRIKDSSGYGSSKSKIEFDDLSKIAIAKGISLQEARALIKGKGHL